MIQDFINKQFFSLFVFTLIFGLLLYGTIGFDFIDEICATLLFILFGYSLFKSQECLINKAFLTTIGVFLFYLCYSLCINSNTKAAIITDFIIQFKPYLALFCVYSLRPHFSTNQKKILRIICVFFWLILLILACIEIFKPHTLSNVMAHATYFAAGVIATSLCFLYTGDFSMKDRILFIIMLSIGLISGRSKFYGFFTLSVMVIIYFSNINHFKLNIKTIILLIITLILILVVSWKKVSFYFIEGITGEAETDTIARFVLYTTSIQILIDYFPFGCGFGSFATYASGLYYSHIYNQYGIENVWGISKSFYSFIADTYYPSLAQFGFVGIMLYITFWIYVFKKALIFFQHTKQAKLMIIVLLLICFFGIEGTSDSTITTHRGLFMMMMIGFKIMKILQLNKYFYQKGGAETVFFNTISTLENRGHQVIPFALKNKKNKFSEYESYFVDYPELSESNIWTKITNTPSFIYNRQAAKQLERLILDKKPDIAHIHLLFNSLSVSILPVLQKYRIPTVMTVHDYRLICPAYTLTNGKGKICELCKDRHFIHCKLNR